jgi:hypothetical protein
VTKRGRERERERERESQAPGDIIGDDLPSRRWDLAALD